MCNIWSFNWIFWIYLREGIVTKGLETTTLENLNLFFNITLKNKITKYFGQELVKVNSIKSMKMFFDIINN